MANSFKVSIKGGKELAKELSKLTEKDMRSDLRVASRAAMKPVEKKAQASAKAFDDSDTPIEVWRNITTRSRWDKRTQAQVTSVGVQGGARYRKKPTQEAPFYWRYIETGTEHQRAQPFLMPALQDNTEKVLSDLVSSLSKRITKRST